MSRAQLEGSEFDWFAVDGDGHIGHFATAGFGPIPSAVLSRLEALRDLDEQILELPIVGESVGHLPGKIDDWLEMARRGLYSFDWQHWSGPYIRAAIPKTPVSIADLPVNLQELLKVVQWHETRFADSMSLRPEDICTCE